MQQPSSPLTQQPDNQAPIAVPQQQLPQPAAVPQSQPQQHIQQIQQPPSTPNAVAAPTPRSSGRTTTNFYYCKYCRYKSKRSHDVKRHASSHHNHIPDFNVDLSVLKIDPFANENPEVGLPIPSTPLVQSGLISTTNSSNSSPTTHNVVLGLGDVQSQSQSISSAETGSSGSQVSQYLVNQSLFPTSLSQFQSNNANGGNGLMDMSQVKNFLQFGGFNNQTNPIMANALQGMLKQTNKRLSENIISMDDSSLEPATKKRRENNSFNEHSENDAEEPQNGASSSTRFSEDVIHVSSTSKDAAEKETRRQVKIAEKEKEKELERERKVQKRLEKEKLKERKRELQKEKDIQKALRREKKREADLAKDREIEELKKKVEALQANQEKMINMEKLKFFENLEQRVKLLEDRESVNNYFHTQTQFELHQIQEKFEEIIDAAGKIESRLKNKSDLHEC